MEPGLPRLEQVPDDALHQEEGPASIGVEDSL